MGKNRGELRNEILYRLGDVNQAIWSGSEINTLIQQGYDEILLRTKALWNSIYIDDVHGQATYDLPADLFYVERATWDDKRVEPFSSRELQKYDAHYMTTEGDVEGYAMDLDGLRKLRKYRVPSADSPSATVTGTFGIPRYLVDVDASEAINQLGIPRLIHADLHYGMGVTPTDFPWGIPRRFPGTLRNFKVEYFRRGTKLDDDNKESELPDWMDYPVRYWVMWKALEREGEGQDLKLASLFQQLYEYSQKRIKARVERNRGERVGVLGGGLGKVFGMPPRPKLPWQYGKVVR